MTEIKRCLDCLYYPMCKEIAAGNCTLASETCTCFESTDGWIPATERRPEHDDIVIAFFPEMRGTESAIQIQKGWSVKLKFCSHWMPLPEPPKEIDS